jgi:hypothetical protein
MKGKKEEEETRVQDELVLLLLFGARKAKGRFR